MTLYSIEHGKLVTYEVAKETAQFYVLAIGRRIKKTLLRDYQLHHTIQDAFTYPIWEARMDLSCHGWNKYDLAKLRAVLAEARRHGVAIDNSSEGTRFFGAKVMAVE